jgi:hypothetical protein
MRRPTTATQITDLQIREVGAAEDSTPSEKWDCKIALKETKTRRRKLDGAKARVAVAWNARFADPGVREVQCPGCGANQTDERGKCCHCGTPYRLACAPAREDALE